MPNYELYHISKRTIIRSHNFEMTNAASFGLTKMVGSEFPTVSFAMFIAELRYTQKAPLFQRSIAQRLLAMQHQLI